MSGAKLYELLAVEVDLRELRLAAVARPLEMAQIEQGMKNKVVTIEVPFLYVSDDVNFICF